MKSSNAQELRAALTVVREYLTAQFEQYGPYDFARRTGAPRSSVQSQYERGWNGNPDTLIKWCEALESTEPNPQPVGYPAGRKRKAGKQ